MGVGTFFSNMVMFFIILTTADHPQPPRHHAHRDDSPGSRSASTSRRQVRRNPVHHRYCRRRISCHPDAGGISGIRIRGNAGMAPRTGQEAEAGTRVLRSHSSLDRSGSRTGLCRHKPREGALLDGGHQRIVSALPSRRNPDRRFGQETDAGPTEFTLGMDRRGDHHSGNVRRGRRHVCCVDCRSCCRRARTLARFRQTNCQNCAVWTGQAILSRPILYLSSR